MIFKIFLFFLTVIFGSGQGLAQEKIWIKDLPEPSLNTLGLDMSPRTFWAGADEKKVIELIEKTTQDSLTPAEAEAVALFLKTDTSSGADAPQQTHGLSFLESRLNGLFTLGFWDDAAAIISLIPETRQTQNILLTKLAVSFLLGKTSEACLLLDTLEPSREADIWRVNCFLAQNENQKAALAYDLFREHRADEKSLFRELGDGFFLGLKTTLPETLNPTPEDIPLLAASGENLPERPMPLWAARALARHPSLAAAKQVYFAERALLPVTDTARAYHNISLDIKNATGAVRRAQLYQRFEQEKDVTEKISLFTAFFKSVQKDGLTKKMAPFLDGMLTAFTPQKETAAMAFDAIQILALTDSLDRLWPWYRFLQQTDPIKASALTPLINHLGGGMPQPIVPDETVCGPQKTSVSCASFLERLPVFFPLAAPFPRDKALIRVQAPVQASFFAQPSFQNAVLFLEGLLLLRTSPFYEASLTDALAALLPNKALQKAFKTERLIYE